MKKNDEVSRNNACENEAIEQVTKKGAAKPKERTALAKEIDEMLQIGEGFEQNTYVAPEPSKSMPKRTDRIISDSEMTFPLCPASSQSISLDEYANNLHIGDVIAISAEGDKYVIEAIYWTEDFDAIQIEYIKNDDRRMCYSPIEIMIENGKYIHLFSSRAYFYKFCDSPNVLQNNAFAQCFFPLCPKDGNISLEEYANLLVKDTLMETCSYFDCYVYDRELSETQDGEQCLYVGVKMDNSLKNYGDMIIYKEHGRVVHQIGRQYFSENYLKRAFCFMREQEWDDSIEVFDDYC